MSNKFDLNDKSRSLLVTREFIEDMFELRMMDEATFNTVHKELYRMGELVHQAKMIQAERMLGIE